MKRKLTIGLFAHVDAGKTTFSEQLLFHGQAIRARGRVDHQDAFLDSHEVEKNRGITVFSEQGYFTYKDTQYYLIDTPGHVDFSSEMERAVQVMDYAIIIVSGIDGVQSHTEEVYDLLYKQGIPIFFFVNKMDADHSDYNACISSIKEICPQAVDYHDPNVYEAVSALDEDLMTHFFNEDFGRDFHERMKVVIQSQGLMLIGKGSALKDQGVEDFLDLLDTYALGPDYKKALSGIVYKIRHDKKGQRETFVKLTGGEINVRDMTPFGQVSGIRLYQGKKAKAVDCLQAGDVGALLGLEAEINDGFGSYRPYSFNQVPLMQAQVKLDPKRDPRKAYQDLRQLALEDPMLNLEYDSSHGDIRIGVMGDIQLEVLRSVFESRFSYPIDFDEPRVIYKETIKNSKVGYGHFEPLKHYAEVHLLLEPNPNRGLEFESRCSLDDLSQGHQNLVEHHLFEKDHHGVLTGSSITDIKVTLLTGASHEKHTSGGDFREATLRALRQGLDQCDVLLLEPYHQVMIKVPADLSGRVMADMIQLKGLDVQVDNRGTKAYISCRVPVQEIRYYYQNLMSFSHGRGSIRCQFSGYEPCTDQVGVVEKIAYDRDRDTAYPSSSVFCKHGKGFIVEGDRVKDYMHCL